MARQDVAVFRQVAVGRLGLLRPCRGVADSHPDAESLWDADHDAAHRACPDMADAIPEDHLGLPVRLDEAAEKLAVREPRPVDAVLAHPAPAWAEFLGLPAWVALAERWAQLRVVAAPCIPDEALSAA